MYLILLNLTKKVYVETGYEFSVQFPKTQTAIVKIKLIDGKEASEQVDYPKGEPENPMGNEEFVKRFMDLMQYGGRSTIEGNKIIELCNEESNLVIDMCEII